MTTATVEASLSYRIWQEPGLDQTVTLIEAESYEGLSPRRMVVARIEAPGGVDYLLGAFGTQRLAIEGVYQFIKLGLEPELEPIPTDVMDAIMEENPDISNYQRALTAPNSRLYQRVVGRFLITITTSQNRWAGFYTRVYPISGTTHADMILEYSEFLLPDDRGRCHRAIKLYGKGRIPKNVEEAALIATEAFAAGRGLPTS